MEKEEFVVDDKELLEIEDSELEEDSDEVAEEEGEEEIEYEDDADEGEIQTQSPPRKEQVFKEEQENEGEEEINYDQDDGYDEEGNSGLIKEQENDSKNQALEGKGAEQKKNETTITKEEVNFGDQAMKISPTSGEIHPKKEENPAISEFKTNSEAKNQVEGNSLPVKDQSTDGHEQNEGHQSVKLASPDLEDSQKVEPPPREGGNSNQDQKNEGDEEQIDYGEDN
jgi:hypothetical protein